jgi:hypothetical protein
VGKGKKKILQNRYQASSIYSGQKEKNIEKKILF